MNLPQIDISALPNLEVMTGMFGSLAQKGVMASSDSVVIVITFLYDFIGDF